MAAIVPYRPVTRSAGGALTKQQDGSARLKKTVINIEKVLQKKRKTTKKLNEQEVATTRFATEQKTRTAAESAMESGSTFSMPMLKKVPSFAVDAFSRIMNFLGIYLIGWVTDKLPKIINAIKDLNQRIQKMGQIVTNMANKQLQIVTSMANLIAAKTKQIATLDFGDKSGDVKRATDQLDAAYDSMQQDYDMAAKIFSAPLGSFPVGDDPGDGGPPLPGNNSFSKEITEDERKALAVLAKYESGAAGYNAVNQIGVAGGRGVEGFSGDIRRMRQHGGRSLEDMTIGEIKALQREERITNSQWIAKGKLHAVGRYQFIGNTLPGVAARAGFSDDTKFTKAVQDKMAIQLIKERGISPWVGPSDKASAAERALVRKVQMGAGDGNARRSGSQTPAYSQAVKVGRFLQSQGYYAWQHPDFAITPYSTTGKSGYTGTGRERVMRRSYNSYHNYGEALDFPLSHNSEAKINKLAKYLKDNRSSLGIAELKWKDDANHFDHLHVSFKGGGTGSSPVISSPDSPQGDLSPLPEAPPDFDMAKFVRLLKKGMARQQAQQKQTQAQTTNTTPSTGGMMNPGAPLNSMLFNSLAYQ